MESKLTINEYGTKRWILPNGKYHREDGPAIEWIDGDKEWHRNGKLHREDGPAVEFNDGFKGFKGWYLNGINYTKNGYKVEMRSRKLKKLL
jgi:hypothetical protein